ncbi:MAG: ABC transporter permease [Thermoguttaceae bacterium]|jgi:putative ABC transport system permease protein
MFRSLLQKLRLGIGSLLLHKLRSALAVLGILIGVTAVIWLVAMGEGVSDQAQQQIKDLGATNIIVRSLRPAYEPMRSDGNFCLQYGLLREDYDRIVANIPAIQQAVPMREVSSEVSSGGRILDAKLIGCTPQYFTLNHLQIARGRFLTDNDFREVNNVAVLGHKTALTLFSYEDPIGKTVQIKGDFYLVVGQTAERVPSAAIGGSLEARQYDSDVYIPLATFRARIGDIVSTLRSGSYQREEVQLSQITVTVRELNEVDETAGIIRTLLEKYHKTVDYAVVVPKELLRQAEMLRAMFNVLLVLIAGISLLVGGIGIMNIMLATVTERTREIGIRRALGATRGDIIQQFLSETVVLSGLGGLLGVGGGFLCQPAVTGSRWLLKQVVPDLMTALPSNLQNLEPRIAPWSVVVALGISVAVGVLFGLYPARRAANMDPIEALRHE